MFITRIQKKYWTFADERKLIRARDDTNVRYIIRHERNHGRNVLYNFFLSPDEQLYLLRHYEVKLKDFCKRFNPPMPKLVVSAALNYFKRFYIYSTVMDYHPKTIALTCLYIACKAEDFNVSISQFVAHVGGDSNKAIDAILNHELLVIKRLHYHLNVLNPFSMVEGLLIDIKIRGKFPDPERLRPAIGEFFDRMFHSDVCLLYTASQIGLAAVIHAASTEQDNLESYVTDILFKDDKFRKMEVFIEAVHKIRSMVQKVDIQSEDYIRVVESKLEKCGIPEEPHVYPSYRKRARMAMDDDDTYDNMYVDTNGLGQILDTS